MNSFNGGFIEPPTGLIDVNIAVLFNHTGMNTVGIVPGALIGPVLVATDVGNEVVSFHSGDRLY